MKNIPKKTVRVFAALISILLIASVTFMAGACKTTVSENVTTTEISVTEVSNDSQKPSGETEAEQATSTTEDATIKITDGLGNEIILEKPAEKVIVFTPSALEIVDALNAMDKVAGVDSWSIESKEPLAEGFEGFGDFQSLNIEKIAAADPDLIMGLVGWTEADLQKLTDLGIKMYITDANTIDEVYTEILNMGVIFGKISEAEILKKNLEKKVEEIKTKLSGLEDTDKPKVFYEVWNDPLMSAGNNTFINDLIKTAGGINIVASDGLSGWPEYSIENLVQNNPNVIIAPVSLAADADVILTDSRFSTVDAVINKRVYIVPDNPLTRPNQNIIKGLEMIAKALHPDIFGEFEIIE
jgi:iron complex transport system substrate-binding protein